MTNGELIEYLKMFEEDAPVTFLAANPKARKLYPVEDVKGIIDAGQPVFCIEVGKAQDMDEEMIKACEEDERKAAVLEGQMNIEDFPEVMP